MSLFDALFGRKPTPELKTIPQWEDTAPPEPEVEAAPVHPHAAWPFPSRVLSPTLDQKVPEHDVAEPEPLVVNTNKLAEYHAEQAVKRRAEKERLKEVVLAAPEHGIEFVHVGTTTFAWRYHTAPEEGGFVRHPLVIDISTAICNPTDQFAKWHGSAVAAERMLAGQCVTLRIDGRHLSPREALEVMGMATLPEYDAKEVQYKIWNREQARKDAVN